MTTQKLIQILRSGGVVVMPTDTVYGLCAVATDKNATDKLYRLKNRQDKPGTLIAASLDQLVELGIKRRYLKAVEQFWPGAISVVVPCEPELDYLDQGKKSIAVRVVGDTKLIEILNLTGPLITTSANKPDQQPANTIQQAQKYFDNKVDAYIDGGDKTDQQASTIIEITDDAIEILREGAVKIDETGNIY